MNESTIFNCGPIDLAKYIAGYLKNNDERARYWVEMNFIRANFEASKYSVDQAVKNGNLKPVVKTDTKNAKTRFFLLSDVEKIFKRRVVE